MIEYYVGDCSLKQGKEKMNMCSYYLFRKDGDNKHIKTNCYEAFCDGIEMQTIAFHEALKTAVRDEQATIYTSCKQIEGAINSEWSHNFAQNEWIGINRLLELNKNIKVVFMSKRDCHTLDAVSDKALEEAKKNVKV